MTTPQRALAEAVVDRAIAKSSKMLLGSVMLSIGLALLNLALLIAVLIVVIVK